MLITGFLVAVLLSASVFQFGREWNQDRARTYNFWLLIGIFVALQFENWWLKGIAALIVMRLMVGPQPLERIKRIDDMLLLTAAAALAIPYVTIACVPYFLYTLIAIGAWTTIYAVVSRQMYTPQRGYDWRMPIWKWELRFYDHPSHIAAGQGNPNHLHGLSVVCAAGALGAGMSLSPWWWLMVPIVLMPLLITQVTKTDNPGNTEKPHQGWAHVLAIGVACLPFWSWTFTAGLVSMLSVMITTEMIRHRHDDDGLDSGRAKLWWTMVREWWPDGWLVRLFGWGPKEFEPHHTQLLIKQMEQSKQFVVAHHAHSEYVHQLLEHGFVGLTLLVGYIVTTAWELWHWGPLGQALYLVGAALCSVAFVSFPWSFYHEIMFRVMPASPNDPAQAKLFTLGTPALVAITFVLVVLIEAIR